jgi:hypothetical protein
MFVKKIDFHKILERIEDANMTKKIMSRINGYDKITLRDAHYAFKGQFNQFARMFDSVEELLLDGLKYFSASTFEEEEEDNMSLTGFNSENLVQLLFIKFA